MAILPGKGTTVRRLVVRTADFDEAHRAMERVFLPMAMWSPTGASGHRAPYLPYAWSGVAQNCPIKRVC
jgi:hypothetical protein